MSQEPNLSYVVIDSEEGYNGAQILNGCEITEILFDGVDTMLIKSSHKVKLNRFVLPVKTMSEPGFGLNWLYELGYTEVITGFSGYGYALRKDGIWYNVDLQNKAVESSTQDPRKDKNFLLGHVIPEDAWNPSFMKIPIKRGLIHVEETKRVPV